MPKITATPCPHGVHMPGTEFQSTRQLEIDADKTREENDQRCSEIIGECVTEVISNISNAGFDYGSPDFSILLTFSELEPITIPLILNCPQCGERHIDQGEFATKLHHTHACQSCGMVWRPAIVATVGVQFLPGFKDDPA